MAESTQGFVHLHNHTTYSLLDGAQKIDDLSLSFVAPAEAEDTGMLAPRSAHLSRSQAWHRIPRPALPQHSAPASGQKKGATVSRPRAAAQPLAYANRGSNSCQRPPSEQHCPDLA